MGFQIVESRSLLGQQEVHLILQGEMAIELSENPDLERWLRTRTVVDRFDLWWNKQDLPELHLRSPEVVMTRSASARGPYFEAQVPRAALPGRNALIKHSKTILGQVFHRFSASPKDGRVHENTGELAAGSYATTETDKPLAPSGFAVVGRYALPNVQPASFCYSIEPVADTEIWIGTVAPAYGQSGGGVEVFFPNGAKSTVSFNGPKRLPDE
jgi:hypothetical protein